MARFPIRRQTRRRLDLLFEGSERAQVERILLQECGAAVVGSDAGPEWEGAVERIRIGVLRCSEGQLTKLRDAVALARTDWRDLLVASGFADDVNAHLSWMPTTEPE